MFSPVFVFAPLSRMKNRVAAALTLTLGLVIWGVVGANPVAGAAAEARETAPKRTALVIGNAKYEPLVGPLRNTVNDSKAVAKTLKALGFTVIEKHDLKRDELLKVMLDFRATLAGAEVGLFYYAGHGISVGGSNYLIPLKSGYTPDGADDVTLRMLAETRLFNIEQAVADMRTGGARCNLIILDACRTTALARTGRTRDAADRGGLAEMKPPAGSLIAFATDAGQTALDGEGTNGLYTEELLKHLRTPGLTIEQVFKRTRAAVLERSDGGQIPAEYSRLVGDDIYLAGEVPPENPTAASPPFSTPAPAPAPTPETASRTPMPAPVPAPTPAPAAVEADASMPRVVKAESLEPPTLAQVMTLATSRMTEESLDALEALAESKGPGPYAEAPLTLMLDQVKDDLKDAETPGPGPHPKIETAVRTCEHVLRILPACLPPHHEQYKTIASKAHNRRGDALVTLSRAEESLESFAAALALTPDDAYILYNRARAYLALGRRDEARTDLQAASSVKLNQPKARKLALEALKTME